MRPYVERLQRHGIPAEAIELPKGSAERAVPAYLAASRAQATDIIGGRSFGGRVASLLAATTDVAGVLLISYPLHRPGGTDWRDRIAHWRDIRCPVLILAGDKDPLARLAFMKEAVKELRHVELATFPGAGHGLEEALDPAMERAASWIESLASR
jgi:predicted alpha/beta-hydrolase family hydrolase